jgi:hypothetical protein
MIAENSDRMEVPPVSAGKLREGTTWYVVDGGLPIFLGRIEAVLSGLTSWWRWEEGRKLRLKLYEPQYHIAKSLLTKFP